jgi:thioredoxin-like negative regulator of GroEL
MVHPDRQPRLTAFVGRSFLPEDEALWNELRQVLDALAPLGFVYEDAKEAQPTPISEKVRAGIARNDVYIGVLSRRHRLVFRSTLGGLFATLAGRPGRWSTSPWVIQESGYALGAGKRVVLLIEETVEFPASNLDADREWISFRRGAISEIGPRLVAVINNLIAERLPAVVLTAQVSAPESKPVSEEAPVPASERASFKDITTLLDKNEFERADEAFEKYLAEQKESSFKSWVRYFYLKLKAIKGHAASLRELRAAVEADPGNVSARRELAAYYKHFDRQGEAVELLISGFGAAPPRLKPALVRDAAGTLSATGAHAKALEMLSLLLKEISEPAEVGLTFMTMADIAKKMPDPVLESAALEQALAIDPADSYTRFRLAYLYSEMVKKSYLAMYHYKLRLAQGADAMALNNLGVAFGALELTGKEVGMLETASPENPLARANLSHAYIDRGFLQKAEALAKEVLAEARDDTYQKRAAAALERVSNKQAHEDEKEESLSRAAQAEAEFRAKYAQAWVSDPTTLIAGIYGTPHGKLSVRQEGHSLVGSVSLQEESPASLFSSILTGGGGTKRLRTRTVHLQAEITGRAGRFQVTGEVSDDSPCAIPDLSSFEGLLVLGGDRQSFGALEEAKEVAKIYRATRVGDS